MLKVYTCFKKEDEALADFHTKIKDMAVVSIINFYKENHRIPSDEELKEANINIDILNN